MSVADAGKVIVNFEKNIMKVVKEGCDLLTNPSSTTADRLKWEQDVKNVFKDGIHDLGDEAQSQATEGATEHLISRGMSKEAAEKWAENSVKRVVEISEKARQTVPKAKFALLKFAGLTTAFFAGVLGISLISHPGPTPEQQAAKEVIRQAEQAQQQIAYLEKIMITPDEFNLMVGGMLVSSAPTPTPDAPVPVAAPAPLPEPIAAVAAEPVQIMITTQGNTRDYYAPLEQVYRNSPPQAQRQIESIAPKIDHGYDHPDPHSCVATDCLNQHRNEWNQHINELNQQRNQKSYAVTMGDGSSTIRVNMR